MKRLTKHVTPLIKLIFNWLLLWFPVVGMYHLIAFTYLFFLPSGMVFHYESIEPVRPEFSTTDKIKMISTSDWYMDATLETIDTLRCPPVSFVSQSITKLDMKKGDKWRGEWVYGRKTPQEPTTCYIESTDTATLDYWIQKKQTIRSWNFNIR